MASAVGPPAEGDEGSREGSREGSEDEPPTPRKRKRPAEPGRDGGGGSGGGAGAEAAGGAPKEPEPVEPESEVLRERARRLLATALRQDAELSLMHAAEQVAEQLEACLHRTPPADSEQVEREAAREAGQLLATSAEYKRCGAFAARRPHSARVCSV